MPSLGVWGPAMVRGCVLAWTAGAGAVWAAPSGLYFGADLGGAMPGELSSTRINVGVPTNCDQWLGAATLNDGTMVPLDVKAGDTVMIGKFAGNEITVDGTDYVILTEDDILGVIDD